MAAPGLLGGMVVIRPSGAFWRASVVAAASPAGCVPHSCSRCAACHLTACPRCTRRQLLRGFVEPGWYAMPTHSLPRVSGKGCST